MNRFYQKEVGGIIGAVLIPGAKAPKLINDLKYINLVYFRSTS